MAFKPSRRVKPGANKTGRAGVHYPVGPRYHISRITYLAINKTEATYLFWYITGELINASVLSDLGLPARNCT